MKNEMPCPLAKSIKCIKCSSLTSKPLLVVRQNIKKSIVKRGECLIHKSQALINLGKMILLGLQWSEKVTI